MSNFPLDKGAANVLNLAQKEVLWVAFIISSFFIFTFERVTHKGLPI